MMIPKGKLLALLLAFTAVGGVAATGAFTTVQADRTASVSTTGDSDALLQIKDTDSPFSTTSNGEVALNFNDNDASGVNLDSETLDDGVIKITNNGNDEVTLFAEASTENGVVKFYLPASELQDPSESSGETLTNDQDVPSVASDGTNRYVIDSESNGVVLDQGEAVTVGVYISTDSVSSDGTNLFDQNDGSDPITITANQGNTGVLDEDENDTDSN